jgi:DNA-binding response OmpR family regulator
MIAAITLLLVEDETSIRDLLYYSLTDDGFEVIDAGNGVHALVEIETDAARFRAIIADIRLGDGPDGWAVAQRARELIYNMPIIYMSGDSSHEWSSKGVPNSVMLAKPFVPAQLITALAILLNKADLSE